MNHAGMWLDCYLAYRDSTLPWALSHPRADDIAMIEVLEVLASA